jgi:PRTRC genetic system protein C
MKNHDAGGKTPSYPEIATASLAGPEDTGDALRYTFSRAIGSKG